MRYRHRFTPAAVALLGLAAACSDQSSTVGPDAAGFSRPSLGAVRTTASGQFVFTVDPTKNETFVFIGEHKIVFPANSICDPATSSYGPTEWDQPCTPAAQPITMYADTATVNGHPYIRFSPDLRFVPSADPKAWVMLYMKDASAADPLVAPTLDILWQTADGSLIDETLADPTLATQVQGSSSIVYRRLKHFTGYLVVTGYAQPADASATLEASVMP